MELGVQIPGLGLFKLFLQLLVCRKVGFAFPIKFI